jgi:hypothetical protein
MSVETIQEFIRGESAAWRVDTAAGAILGVKVLGPRSKNGRIYTEQALSGGAQLYEGVKVNVNHPKGAPSAPRDYQDRLGTLQDIEYRVGEGLFGTLRFNPKHALAEQIAWDAEHSPGNLGLSHNVEARTVRRDGETIVEAVLKVLSVDLVADPATTAGLFEGRDSSATDTAAPREIWTLDDLRRQCPALLAEAVAEERTALCEARGELESLKSELAMYRRRETIEQLLGRAGLSARERIPARSHEIVGESFLRQLLNARDDATVERLIEERGRLLRSIRYGAGEGVPCRSREQRLVSGSAEPPRDAREFASAVLVR